MEITTAWVRAPEPKSGLDHLSAQAPCISVYQQLLPGITNVTYRARCYSLYTWLIWSFDERYPKADAGKFEQIFRRADCLLTLIAERHARITDQDNERHGVSLVGREKLVPALTQIETGGHLRLSTYATRDDVESRYFKNRLGGLGQYYVGTLEDLGILAPREGSWIRYSLSDGLTLAKAIDAAVESDAFFALVEKDKVTVADLDSLAGFCPCQLSKSRKEHQLLLDLFFDRTNKFGAAGEQRAKTLALLLDLAENLSDKGRQDLSVDVFRSAIYTGYLPGKKSWKIPAALDETRQRWFLYQRNELLSLAIQGIFAVTLDLLQKEGITPLNSRACARWLCESDEASRVLKPYRKLTLAQIVAQTRKQLPPLADWTHEMHELHMGRSILRGYQFIGNEIQIHDHVELLKHSLQLLIQLVSRDKAADAPYGDLVFPSGFFEDHPINLASLQHRATDTWLGLTAGGLLEWLCVHWGIDAHLRVALRKLRSDSRPTFQIQPTETGLRATGVPPPASTNPRITQTIQILIDIGALRRSDKHAYLTLTDLGRKLRGEITG